MQAGTAPLGLPGGTDLGRCAVIGILNVTPDSFSDGGRYLDLHQAIGHAEQLYSDGADLVDVGGESTRPGAQRIDVETEIERVVPVIKALNAYGIPTTIDTMRSVVARAAIEAGASAVNDVSGGLADPLMAGTVADLDVPWILMHWRAHSNRMATFAEYDDVVTDVLAELLTRVDAALAAGVRRERLAIDPGLGFAKTAAHNWRLLAALGAFNLTGFPVLVGASRKSFLGALLAAREPRPADEREDATTAVTALAAAAGVWAVRTHNVRASIDAVKVAQAWESA